MKTPARIMIVCILALVTTRVNAQPITWQQSVGPDGGAFSSLGRIEGILVVASQYGTIYRSFDRGHTWSRCSKLVSSSVTFASVGSTLFASASPLVRSTDSGATWIQDAADSLDRAVFDFGVNDSMIFVTSSNGVFRSNDEGVTWVHVNRRSSPQAFCADGSTLYLVVHALPSLGGGFYRSTDNGDHWTLVDTVFASTLVDALTSRGDTVLASVSNDQVLRSVDGGATWSAIAYEFGGGNTRFLRDNSSIYASGLSPTIHRSTDQGATWTPINPPLSGHWVDGLQIVGTSLFIATEVGVFRSDNNGIDWQPANVGLSGVWINNVVSDGPLAYTATQSGLFASVDSGKTWTLDPGRFAGANTYSLAHRDSEWFVQSPPLNITDASNLYRSRDNGASWDSIDMIGPSEFFSCSRGFMIGGGFGGLLFRSSDAGGPWEELNPELDAGSRVESFVLSDSLVLVYVRTADGTSVLRRSTDFGSTWTTIADPSGRYSYLAVVGGTIFAAGIKGVLRSRDLGNTWQGISDDTTVTQLFANGRIVVTSSPKNGLEFSFDAGDHWMAGNDGLPSYDIYDLWIDRGQVLAALTSGGVYRTVLSQILQSPDPPAPIVGPAVTAVPNPASTKVTVHYALGEQACVRIQLCDVLGRVVLHSSSFLQEPGYYAPELNVSALPRGQYFCYILGPRGVPATTVVVAH